MAHTVARLCMHERGYIYVDVGRGQMFYRKQTWALLDEHDPIWTSIKTFYGEKERTFLECVFTRIFFLHFRHYGCFLRSLFDGNEFALITRNQLSSYPILA